MAVAVELLEAAAIVLAVGVTRRWRDALIGAVAGVLVCVALAVALAPVLDAISVDALRAVIGTLLLLYGLEWLRKGTLRRAGLKARASSVAEYDETVHELEEDPLPRPGQPDWAGRGGQGCSAGGSRDRGDRFCARGAAERGSAGC